MKANSWLSYYIYYESGGDDLLAKSVWPLVQRLHDRQLIEKFFFIRYADKQGLHIRLRLLPSHAAVRHTVRRQVKASLPRAKFVKYTPEIERYGGPVGLPIAEDVFEASSIAALQLLHGGNAWSYRRALAAALQMHLGMLQAFDVSRAEAIALSKHLVPASSLVDFEQSFAMQRQTVAPSLRALWASCEKNVDFKVKWFADWHQAMIRVGHKMHSAHNRGKLILPAGKQHDSPLWALYESYMHMTNNRLGVLNRDEPFIAYILQSSLTRHAQ